MSGTKSEGRGIIVALAIIFFLAFEIGGIITLTSSIKGKIRCSEYAEGIVVENKIYHSGKGRTFSPIVQFKANGKMILVESNLRTSPKSFEEGDKVTLHYNPDNVANIWIDGHNSNSFIVIGSILIILGIALPIVIIKFA